jgi:hypothetical protein
VQVLALACVLVVHILNRKLLLNREYRIAGAAMAGDCDCLIVERYRAVIAIAGRALNRVHAAAFSGVLVLVVLVFANRAQVNREHRRLAALKGAVFVVMNFAALAAPVQFFDF